MRQHRIIPSADTAGDADGVPQPPERCLSPTGGNCAGVPRVSFFFLLSSTERSDPSAWGRSVLLFANKRKSDDPCRWVIAFLVPCGTGRVNDKKVNEENSKVKNKSVCGAEFTAPKRRCIQVSLLLDTTYHFRTEIARGFLKFLPKNTREIAFL